MKKAKYKISWDISDGGKEWCVLVWIVKSDNTHILWQKIDKNSDDAGSFDFPLVPPQNTKVIKQK